MERGDLQRLSKDELIDLVLRLQRPEKTSRTSSKPPATDQRCEHTDQKSLACRTSRDLFERHRRLDAFAVAAPLPDAAKGTPFGCGRFQLRTPARRVFGLTISQAICCGGPDSLMSPLLPCEKIIASERPVCVSQQAYQWVFRSSEAVVHRAVPTRGAVVVRDLMDGHRPEVWCSDRYSAQQGHGTAHQACLAHFARDVAYADQASDDMLPSRLRLWLKRAFALADGIETFAASTIATKCRDLERSLTAILAAPTTCDLARDLQMKFQRARDQLLTFAAYPGLVEPTNNACERALRPAVIQRRPTAIVRCGRPRARLTFAPSSIRQGCAPAPTPFRPSSRPSASDSRSRKPQGVGNYPATTEKWKAKLMLQQLHTATDCRLR